MNPLFSKLVGTWKSSNAVGVYPNIKDFNYEEVIKFEENNQPLLHFSSITKIGDSTKHCEKGFLRMLKPNSNQVCSLEAHNIGITIIYEGIIEENKVTLKSTEISRMSTSKEPHVTEMKKVINLVNENELVIEIDMATTKTPLTNHLKASYKRQNA